MSKKAFIRIYKNNSRYTEDKLPYIDALALTVQKHFYIKRNAVYYLGGTIKLWDFMTLTRYYITASMSEFGQSDIETYISAMDNPQTQLFGGNAVEYTERLDHIILNGTPAMVLSLMWAAWVYAKVRFNVAGDDTKDLWERAAEQLYNSMEDYYDSPEHKCFGESNRLFSIAGDAANTMGCYIEKKYSPAKKTQVQQPVPTKEDNMISLEKGSHYVKTGEEIIDPDEKERLLARIAELERELSKQKAENEELKAENEALKKQLEGYQSEEPAEEIEWHDKVRLELLLKLLENSGTNTLKVVKTRVAEVMQSVTGLPISTCKNYCTNRNLNTNTHEEEILKLNSKLQAINTDIRL